MIYIIDDKSVRFIRRVFRLIVSAALAAALLSAFENCWHWNSFKTELPVYLLCAVVMAAIMNDICGMSAGGKTIIRNALILAFVYVLIVFLLNNIWRYCRWQFLFGNSYLFRVFIDDLEYSYGLGWARYPALFLSAMAGLLSEHCALRRFKNIFLKYRYRKARRRERFTDFQK